MKCPYCLDIEMKVAFELGKDWHKCPNCGATHVENPQTGRGGKLVKTELNDLTGLTKYTPSGSFTAKVRRIREGKK